MCQYTRDNVEAYLFFIQLSRANDDDDRRLLNPAAAAPFCLRSLLFTVREGRTRTPWAIHK